MSEENKVVINDEEYNFGDLAIQTQADIARVAELRREVATLQRQIAERNALLSIYEEQIKKSVQTAAEPETAEGLPDNFKEH